MKPENKGNSNFDSSETKADKLCRLLFWKIPGIPGMITSNSKLIFFCHDILQRERLWKSEKSIDIEVLINSYA